MMPKARWMKKARPAPPIRKKSKIARKISVSSPFDTPYYYLGGMPKSRDCLAWMIVRPG